MAAPLRAAVASAFPRPCQAFARGVERLSRSHRSRRSGGRDSPGKNCTKGRTHQPCLVPSKWSLAKAAFPRAHPWGDDTRCRPPYGSLCTACRKPHRHHCSHRSNSSALDQKVTGARESARNVHRGLTKNYPTCARARALRPRQHRRKRCTRTAASPLTSAMWATILMPASHIRTASDRQPIGAGAKAACPNPSRQASCHGVSTPLI